jgi:hypothetical protein
MVVSQLSEGPGSGLSGLILDVPIGQGDSINVNPMTPPGTVFRPADDFRRPPICPASGPHGVKRASKRQADPSQDCTLAAMAETGA